MRAKSDSARAPARSRYWWRDPGPGAFRGAANPNVTKMPLIPVKGNRFVDPDANLYRSAASPSPIPTSSRCKGTGTEIDWHSIGNMTTGVYQDPMYDTTREETSGCWQAMSRRYGRHIAVAFFELFNELAPGITAGGTFHPGHTGPSAQ